MKPGARPPGWLDRPAAPTAFVATVCAESGTAGVAARIAQGLGASSAPRELSARAVEFEFKATPAAAWAAWQELRDAIDGADLYLQPADTPASRLLICDMDMTIVAAETLDEVAAELGLGDEISRITTRAMLGEIDFDAALRERIAMLAGRDERVFHEVAGRLDYNHGARALIDGARAAGVHTILISGGFAQVAEPVARELGFAEVVCNRLDIENGRLTGTVPDPIVNAALKRRTLQQRARALGLDPALCCAIGDGANDALMLEAAGLGIAYRGKPVLRAATDCHLDFGDLECALYLMRTHTLTPG